ncbi:hypothetical protein D1AOALGA4SA_9672 [Olavius algarvensis Delta 1 endosymbiont]|nr:hypothetical protein D1AOALGA4SA_9672 [Olavius algarvensis Delta 1 endosymbiont]
MLEYWGNKLSHQTFGQHSSTPIIRNLPKFKDPQWIALF